MQRRTLTVSLHAPINAEHLFPCGCECCCQTLLQLNVFSACAQKTVLMWSVCFIITGSQEHIRISQQHVVRLKFGSWGGFLYPIDKNEFISALCRNVANKQTA